MAKMTGKQQPTKRQPARGKASPDLRVQRSPQEKAAIGREWEGQGHEWEAEGQAPGSSGPERAQQANGLPRQGYDWDRPERGRGQAERLRTSSPGRGARAS